MKTYNNLQEFANSFNITTCYNKRFMKRKGGYVTNAVINGNSVEVVITPVCKNNQPLVFNGSLEQKTIQALQKCEGTNFKILNK